MPMMIIKIIIVNKRGISRKFERNGWKKQKKNLRMTSLFVIRIVISRMELKEPEIALWRRTSTST